jgi:hypothetical protein
LTFLQANVVDGNACSTSADTSAPYGVALRVVTTDMEVQAEPEILLTVCRQEDEHFAALAGHAADFCCFVVGHAQAV